LIDGVGVQGRTVNSTPVKTSRFWKSSRVKTLSKNLIAPPSRAGPSTGNGSGGTWSRQKCARGAGDVNAEEQQREKERCIHVQRKRRRHLVI
jgi:hypothetical protein